MSVDFQREAASGLHQDSRRTFHFSDKRTTERLDVVIPEVLDPAYGMYVWPCAPVLAQFIWFHRQKVQGKIVLELGSGTALPGVVAAKCGAKVTLSDSAVYWKCLDNCRASCQANGLDNVSIKGITWGQFTPDLLQLGPIHLLLGSDCFYDKKDFEDVIVTVSFLLKKNRGCEFWCTYQERSSNWSISHLLDKWQLSCERIPLDTFEAGTGSVAGSEMPGRHTIHMLIFRTRESVT